jgi:hypothetical protein
MTPFCVALSIALQSSLNLLHSPELSPGPGSLEGLLGSTWEGKGRQHQEPLRGFWTWFCVPAVFTVRYLLPWQSVFLPIWIDHPDLREQIDLFSPICGITVLVFSLRLFLYSSLPVTERSLELSVPVAGA